MTLQQLRYVTAVAGTGTISHAVQQFYISQPSLTNAIRELEQEVRLALSKTVSSVVSWTLLDARGIPLLTVKGNVKRRRECRRR